MSHRLFEEDVLFQQRLLACVGLYEGKLDGIWGPKTQEADRRWDTLFLLGRLLGEQDGRSEAAIRTLLPPVQRLARIFLSRLATDLGAGITARIISGTRTYAEQTELFRQGRDIPGARVTNARAGQSNHNFGLAFDIGIFDHGRYLPESPLYALAGSLVIAGLEWGGNWTSFQDRPHYQMPVNGLTLPEIRRQFEAGQLRITTTAPTGGSAHAAPVAIP